MTCIQNELLLIIETLAVFRIASFATFAATVDCFVLSNSSDESIHPAALTADF
jgi:hypothetical protein